MTGKIHFHTIKKRIRKLWTSHFSNFAPLVFLCILLMCVVLPIPMRWWQVYDQSDYGRCASGCWINLHTMIWGARILLVVVVWHFYRLAWLEHCHDSFVFLMHRIQYYHVHTFMQPFLRHWAHPSNSRCVLQNQNCATSRFQDTKIGFKWFGNPWYVHTPPALK